MNAESEKRDRCFGKLKAVFPKGADGLRITPEACMPCPDKTECLRLAMAGTEGLAVREEVVDRAYSSGLISFWQRWSQKKIFQRKIRALRKGGPPVRDRRSGRRPR